MIEMAVAMPLLLYVMFGMVEFGQYFYIRTTFESAARDAGRAAVLHYAAAGDPAAAATRTLALSNVTFNSSWLTINDYSNANAVVTDVSTVAVGHVLIVTLSATYSQVPNAYRPLYQFTGLGISSTKLCAGYCTVVKE